MQREEQPSTRRHDDPPPGIRRLRAGRGFSYRTASGDRVTDATTLARIRSLAIPPAWTDVWICPSADGHLQATGRDARGRKQYRYHEDWRAAREVAKFGALHEFGAALPSIRRRRDRDLLREGTGIDRVTAGVVLLLEATMMRVGNEEYVRANGHYGLTTLRARHVRVGHDGRVALRFTGKSGIEQRAEVCDPRLAALVEDCRRLRGDHLFQARHDDGQVHAVTSADVNAYLRDAAGTDVTAKDFRTWLATVEATVALAVLPPPRSAREAARHANAVIDEVAGDLGNTRAVCRASYVHPAVLESFADGSLAARWSSLAPTRTRGLSADENAVLALLRTLERGRTRFARAA